MQSRIRMFEERDQEAIVALSLRAWAPVFSSLENVLGGSGVYAQLHPDWRADQQRAVETTCNAENTHVWVAEMEATVAGFVAVQLNHDTSIGEIPMLAVDPEYQRSGLGSSLTAFALDWIKDNGMALAMVETGGDAGHARRGTPTSKPVSRSSRSLDISRSFNSAY